MKSSQYPVLPWSFRDEFIERERAMIAQGAGLMFLLPGIEIMADGDAG